MNRDRKKLLKMQCRRVKTPKADCQTVLEWIKAAEREGYAIQQGLKTLLERGMCVSVYFDHMRKVVFTSAINLNSRNRG